jgi:hypothetical protein
MSRSQDAFAWVVVLGLGLAVVFSAAGWIVFEHFVEASSREVATGAPPVAASPQPPPAVVPDVRAIVTGVVGMVERTAGKDWVEVRIGDVLELDDSIRTGVGARAELQVGDESSRLSIPERSEVRIGEVTRAAHAFQLARGRIDVDYRGQGERVLRVRSGEDAVAETREARFTMLRGGTMVAVATRGGSVWLSAAGGSVEVGAGYQSVVFDGAQPLAAEPIPVEVLLKVAAQAAVKDTLCASLSGQVRPGTEVFVEDEPAEVLRDGTFRMDVPQRAGLSRVRVWAREPGGSTRETLLACRPRARAGLSGEESVKFRWEEAP